jgi:DNA modification methylase
MDKINWSSKTVSISELSPAEYNPRKLSEDSEKHLTTSIDKFSLADPIVVNKNMKIIGGHQRLKILKKMGTKDVDVRFPDRLLSDTEEKELNLRLNKNIGEWDFDALSKFDEGILKDVGFDPKDLDEIFKVIDPKDADEVPDKRPETSIKPGHLFQLGEHRLLCGDSTNAGDVARLMAGEKADMVFTDPPYGVNYTKKTKLMGSKEYSEISGDGSLEDAEKIWAEAFKNIGNNINPDGGSYYVCAPQGGDQMMMMMMMKSHIPCKHELIWVKPSPVFSMGRLDYDYQHEPILYGWKGSHKFLGAGKFKKSVWEIGRDSGKLHPTMKPVELVENAIYNSSERGAKVLDLFGGSGSTLIACEQTSRRCRMMEIDPIYCQVIIDRWEGISGKTAQRI